MTFTAWENSTPVGMVRLLGDGGMSFYLKDFAVRPAYQGAGAGSALIDTAENYIRSSIPNSVGGEFRTYKHAARCKFLQEQWF